MLFLELRFTSKIKLHHSYDFYGNVGLLWDLAHNSVEDACIVLSDAKVCVAFGTFRLEHIQGF